jgi:urease accessory protein
MREHFDQFTEKKMTGISSRQGVLAIAGLAAFSAAAPALAHPGVHHVAMSVATGFAHPFSGLDHMLAFAAIGLWSAQYHGRTAWILPLLFVTTMTLGALAGLAGMRIPGIEAGIAASVAILGLLVAFSIRMPLAASGALVSVFALMHGYAHGVELPQQMSAASYIAGFAIATGLLHLIGFAAASVAGRLAAGGATRLAGIGIAATGAYLLAAVV